MASVVAVNSTWDEATQRASLYRRTFVQPLFQQAGLLVVELEGADANAQAAHDVAADPAVVYLTGVSHGRSDAFTGDGDRGVFNAGQLDPACTAGRVVHFLACNTALLLGPDMIAAGGATAFFGYKGSFSWPADDNSQYAAFFFDCDAEIDRALAEGNTAGDALARAKDKYQQQITALEERGDDMSRKLAAMLTVNLGLLCGPDGANEYGSPEARIL